VFYGLPAAGVLAMELLQQKQSQLRSENPPRASAFPTSTIIQELSVFISSLRFVHAPGDGNYALTEQARKTLQQILDRVLSMETTNHVLSERVQLQTPISNGSFLGEMEETAFAYDFAWMENAQIDDFWTNLPDHPLLS
jgi:hypothetical protein